MLGVLVTSIGNYNRLMDATGAQAGSLAPQLAVGFFASFLGLLAQVLIET